MNMNKVKQKSMNMNKVKQKNTHSSKFRSFLSPYIPTNIKKLLRIILQANKADSFTPLVLGNNIPGISSENFNTALYTKNYNDLKRLIYEIENELGKPSYTEDEALGFYISRSYHA